MRGYWYWITHEPGQLPIFLGAMLGLTLGAIALTMKSHMRRT